MHSIRLFFGLSAFNFQMNEHNDASEKPYTGYYDPAAYIDTSQGYDEGYYTGMEYGGNDVNWQGSAEPTKPTSTTKRSASPNEENSDETATNRADTNKNENPSPEKKVNIMISTYNRLLQI